MAEIRVPGEFDREQVFDVTQIELNPGRACPEHRSSVLPPVVPFLSSLLAGPAPWMPDSF